MIDGEAVVEEEEDGIARFSSDNPLPFTLSFFLFHEFAQSAFPRIPHVALFAQTCSLFLFLLSSMPTLLFLLPLLPFSMERTRVRVLLIKYYYLTPSLECECEFEVVIKAGFIVPVPVSVCEEMEELAAAKSFFEGCIWLFLLHPRIGAGAEIDST
jgi:hypothetical protein